MKIEDQMKYHELQAMWWMNSATNNHCCKRNIIRNGIPLTNEEHRNNAMETSQRHMELFMECAQFKQKQENKQKYTQYFF